MHKAKILIVDDERSVRQALKFELEDEGYEIYYASNYDEALSAVKAFDIDMVITDVYLGDGDGIQLMELMRRVKQDVTFIVISAFPDSDLGIRARNIMHDRFYEKPFVLPEFTRKVNELLLPRTAAAAYAV
ncbi:MAG: response regulator [Calditrichaceae bacterium]|nr:response regulator [Calditrichaceae bacterium]MBN2709533.1 response regulator [Calditrichaceae bacterium]RQV95842.1 MAG: response regulator [Calditrichota bacterium]